MTDDHGEPTLLVVHHTPSPPTRELLEKVLEGTADPEISGVRIRPVAALAATVPDVLSADGFLFGTPANFGYMSGALKHFFDTVFYPCLDATTGLPYGVYVHGNDDTAGALTSVQRITGALRWTQVAAPLSLVGAPTPGDLDRVRELAATVAVSL
jgi:multimeric flavodoxin WrbA